MKKHSLFKVILIVLGALVCVNGILAIIGNFVEDLAVFKMIPLFDTLLNFVQSFYYFFDTLVFVLVLGAFYAVLNKIPAYKKLVDNIAQKVKEGNITFKLVNVISLIVAVVAGLHYNSIVSAYIVFSIANIIGYVVDKLIAKEKLSTPLHNSIPFGICSIVLTIIISLIVNGVFNYSLTDTVLFGLKLFAVLISLVLSLSAIFNLTFGLIFKISSLFTKESNNKAFVCTMTILFAVLTSATGLTNVLLVFVPFVVAIILLLGYDKLVAISSTIAAMLVGLMGGVFITFRDANSYYGYAATTFAKFTGISEYANLVPQLIILVLGTALLIFFINRHIKSVQDKKVKYELNDSDEVLVSEVKGDYKTIKTWPMILVLSVLFVILVLGYMPWNSLFGIECFNDFDTWLKGLTIGEFAVVPNVISGNLSAFGAWASLGSYMSITSILIILTLIIKFAYRVKFDELLEDFMSGAKKMVPMVCLIALTFAILVCAYNFGFMYNLITLISDKIGLNLATNTFLSAVGTLLHSDLYYTVAGVFSNITANADESLLPVYAMTYQSIYGLVSVIAPTSLFVVFALKYFDVPYTSWVKYIWRFVLMLFLLVILVLLVLSLI